MSYNNNGIAFAQDNHSMSDHKWQYTSTKPKLTVSSGENPSNLGVLNLDGGTVWTVNPGDFKQETLLQVKHPFPFTPEFLCYFFTADAPIVFASRIGQYSLDIALMRDSGVSWFESLSASSDAHNFYIKHTVNYSGIGPADSNYGSQYKFRVRFEIIARKAVYTGQGVTGT